MIPKVIYQTFYTKYLPVRIQSSIDKMKLNNPNYDYYLYDDVEIENFIKNEFDDETYRAFTCLNVGAAKADLWRYCILYKKGGIYLDVDSEFNGSIDELISEKDTAIISRESHKDIFLQWCLIFPPNHPILEICIRKCVENILSKKSSNVLHLTGPVVFSESVIEHCKEDNLWNTDDSIINKILEYKNKNTHLYSTDYKNFCRFKTLFSNDLEILNRIHKGYGHWSEEKKIFTN